MISFNKMVWKLSHGDSRARATRSYIALIGVKLGESRFGSSQLEDGVHQEDLGTLFSLCTLLKIFMFIAIHELRGSFYEA